MVKLKENKLIYFRTEASNNIGLGHLMRDSALAQCLEAGLQLTPFFLIKSEASPIYNKNRFKFPHQIVPDDEVEEIKLLKKIVSQDAGHFFIVDSYLVSETYILSLKKAFPNISILAFDDYGEKLKFEVDGVINFSVTSLMINYPATIKEKSLLGPQFYPLRDEFIKQGRGKTESTSSARTIVVTMGGGDPDNITLRMLKCLQNTRELKPIFDKALVILGPAYKGQSTLVTILDKNPWIEVVEAPSNMASVLSKADLVISAAGSTCHEIAFLKRPMAVISISEDQVLVAKALEKIGCAFFLGHYLDINDLELTAKLEAFILNSQEHTLQISNQESMISEKGQNLILKRFAELMLRSERV